MTHTSLPTNWIIDGNINLCAVAVESNWHLATIIEKLTAAGLTRGDAEAFADFICNEYACLNGTSDHDSEECVNDAQYDRLSI